MKKKLFILILIILLSLTSVNIGLSAIEDKMVSYWTFDNSNTINGKSIDTEKRNNGTLEGVKTGISGKVGEAYNFSGNDYVEVNHDESLDNPDSFSLSVWAKSNTNSYDGYAIIADIGHMADHGYGIFINKDTNEVSGYHTSVWPDVNCNETIDTKWNNYILTHNKTDLTLYCNSNKKSSVKVSDTYIDNTPFRIGAQSKRLENSRYFDGIIDEVAVWNRSLNTTEIKEIYNRTNDGEYDYLGNYKLDTPLTNTFSTNYGTTNFSAVDDLTQVPNMTLASSNSKVNWKNNVNAKSQNFDKNVKLDQGLVSVNSTALDSTINSSATVSLDADSCSSFNIYKADKPVDSLSELKTQGSIVGDENGCTNNYCSNLSCSSGELTYDVTHFSSTGSDSTSNETVPEFSTYTLLLAVAITILGFYTIRK